VTRPAARTAIGIDTLAIGRALDAPLALVGSDHPALRAGVAPIADGALGSRELRELVSRMWRLLGDIPHGLGLAAPQLGLSFALFIARDEERGVTVVNPRRAGQVSFEVIDSPEGCLSLPGYEAVVRRPARVTIDCRDHLGGRGQLDASGTMARVFDHELDHLAGRLFIDRANLRTFAALPLPDHPAAALLRNAPR
jgi:peptide deformylase